MKNLFFSLAFLLVGSIALANNGLINEKPANNLENGIELDVNKSTKIDFATFSEMVKKGDVSIVKIVKLDQSFLFLDDCGNWWLVEYDSSVFTPFSAFLTASAMIYDATGC